MEDKELIDIANNIINNDINSACLYSNTEWYNKVKADYISYFKNEEVAKYSFEANRVVYNEYSDDNSKDFLKATLRCFVEDSASIENRLDLISALIIWNKRTECEF